MSNQAFHAPTATKRATVARTGLDSGSTNRRRMAKSLVPSIRAAITIIASAPILLVYPFLQKYFVVGLNVGSIKE